MIDKCLLIGTDIAGHMIHHPTLPSPNMVTHQDVMEIDDEIEMLIDDEMAIDYSHSTGTSSKPDFHIEGGANYYPEN